MDKFARHFFPDHLAPGADFKLSDNCETATYIRGQFELTSLGIVGSKRHVATQLMTPAGLTTARIVGRAPDFDGMTRDYVTADTRLNVTLLSDALKYHGGRLQAQVQHWDWGDNEVSLMVNALRFVFLRELTDAGSGNLNVNLALFDDNHVQVNRNQYFGAAYPAAAEWEWPCGIGKGALPRLTRVTDMISETPTLDVTGLTANEAVFMLMMTGRWRRRSRYRLDFELPCLIEEMQYRGHDKLPPFTFTEDTPEDRRTDAPALTDKQTAWSALQKFVRVNRLFSQFSTALYVVCGLAYQFLPATAEGQYWLSINWQVVLPEFHPVRGRTSLLNSGPAALASHRALSEWSFINAKMEKVNLMALIFCQAALTGFGVRSTRRGLEDYPRDLINTEGSFYNMYSASAAECTRIDVPLSGMQGVYIHCDEMFEDVVESRRVITLNNDPADFDGREYEMGVVSVQRLRRMPGLEALTAGQWRYSDIMLTPNEEAGLMLRAEQVIAGTPEWPDRPSQVQAEFERLATELRHLKRGAPPDMVDVYETIQVAEYRLKVPRLPLAGAPLLLLPVNSFGYNSPFHLEGQVSRAEGSAYRNVWDITWPRAWQVAQIYRLAGYKLLIEKDGGASGPEDFQWPDDVGMVWPVLRQENRQCVEASVTGQEEPGDILMEIPDLSTPAYEGVVSYRVVISQRGVAVGHNRGMTAIKDYGGAFVMYMRVTPGYKVSAGVARLQGYISRQAAEFNYVGDA